MSDNDTPRRIGGLMIATAWILILAVAVVIFQGLIDERRNPNQQVATRVQDGNREVTLERNTGGHYVATGRINGEAVEFLLDTGATDVSIPQATADRLDLDYGSAAMARTASGVIRVYRTTLDRVALGDIVLRDVRATINPHSPIDSVLLGMSFMGELELEQRNDRLTLRQPLP
jgi:aspartyl protease family protein